MANHTSDMDLTQHEYVTKYTTGQYSVGNSEEIREYLRKRWDWMNKLCSHQEVHIAYLKTGLGEKKNNSIT